MPMHTFHFLLDQEIVLDKSLLKWKKNQFFHMCLEDWTLHPRIE